MTRTDAGGGHFHEDRHIQPRLRVHLRPRWRPVCGPGWTFSGVLGTRRAIWELVEVWNVYPQELGRGLSAGG